MTKINLKQKKQKTFLDMKNLWPAIELFQNKMHRSAEYQLGFLILFYFFPLLPLLSLSPQIMEMSNSKF